MSRRHRQRSLAGRAGLAVALAVLLGLTSMSIPSHAGSGTTIRLLTVGAAQTGGLLNQLVTRFEQDTGYDVIVTMGGENLFDQARAGQADLVLAHFGFGELQRFVTERSGMWPELVMSNVVAFLAPPGDPASVASASDPVQAFQQIVEAGHPWVVNNLGETKFISDTLWHAAGEPAKDSWYVDPGLSGPAAVREAARLGGYTLWGLHPFLQLQQSPQPVNLSAVLSNDSLLQRALATVVVTQVALDAAIKPNVKGALALQAYLISPAVQARIRNFRLPAFDQPVFYPAANNNDN